MLLTAAIPVLLALQAHAIPATELPQPKEPKHGNLIGDLLNITSCFCASPVEEDNRYGFYLQADYVNYHNGGSYQTHQICTGGIGKVFSFAPHCWSEEPVPEKKICDEDADRNTFCFERDYQSHHAFWK